MNTRGQEIKDAGDVREDGSVVTVVEAIFGGYKIPKNPVQDKAGSKRETWQGHLRELLSQGYAGFSAKEFIFANKLEKVYPCQVEKIINLIKE